MKQFILLCFLLVTISGSAQVNRSVMLSADTTTIPGKIVMVNGDEVLDMDIGNNIDSLLSIWYIQRALQDETSFMAPETPVVADRDLPDSVYIARLKALPSLIDLPYNHVVRNHIIFYTQRMGERAEMVLGLAEHYFPIIEEILDMYDMPLELRNMAVIESALNNRAVSRAKARGMWQFMYGTAKMYNLTMNSFVEERYDPIAATHAAARHMRDLYRIFGDWSLAIAAYNCGTGNVNKAIRRSGGKRDYWDIYPYLPRETRGYVPAFVAANYLMTYYREHGLTPKRLNRAAHIDTFMVHRPLHFEQISEVIGIPMDQLRYYNPQYIHDIIPGNERPYVLRIPFEYTSAFVDNEKEIYSFRDSVYFNRNIIRQIAGHSPAVAPTSGGRVIHQVRSGETLSTIAQRYRVKVNDLKYWNGLTSNTIRVGQKLAIHGQAAPAATAASTQAAQRTTTTTNAPAAQRTTTAGQGTVIHTVKKGETLWSISQLYDDVTFFDLMQLNNLNRNSKIFPGDKIKIKG